MRAPYLLLASLLLTNTGQASTERFEQASFADSITVQNSNQVLQQRSRYLLEYLFVDVYSAALYADENSQLASLLTSNDPLRLELYYYRSIKRGDVIKAAWTALNRQYDATTLAELKPKVDRLHATFTDIQAGDRYSLTRLDDGALVLQLNGATVFTSNDQQLADAYLGIWLRANGLSDDLRNALLN
ncbi:chalcone isomerase family protein [Halopseudomonas sp.]|uniref:chalcone isomerase family protein n=1 Tax=Halopseudomonas sp. TaxID=2901191 RepID=UPI003001A8D0